MENICYNCFNSSLNEVRICTLCGFDGKKNREKYPLALPLGSILYGRYIIGRVLGQGGFGITYLAQDYQTKGLVAIKEFFPDTMATRTSGTTVTPFSGERGENFVYGREGFLEEAKTMAEFIGNPNITRVYSYFEENGTGYFVMEYLEGDSFLDYIKSRGGRISWEETMRVVLPVMDALTAMHAKGIIHRDVTPDNIYITKDGTVKLLDFGAARYSLGNVSRSLDVILKHGFAPKEQYNRHGRQGPYTDVYSLGATIYYAITGTKPDDSIERAEEDNMPLPTTLGARITEAQEDALLKGLEVQPGDRYQTMAEFRAALTASRQEETKTKTAKDNGLKYNKGKEKAPEKEEPSQQMRKLPKWLIPVGAAAVVFTVVNLAIAAQPKSEPEPKPEPAPAILQTETGNLPEDPDDMPLESIGEDITVTTLPAPTDSFAYLGGYYQGQTTDDGQPNGTGTLTWEGCSYSGNFVNGYPQGMGEVTYSVDGDSQKRYQDNWNFTSGDYRYSLECSWMNQTLQESVGRYRGLTYEDSAGRTVLWGWGELEFDCGGRYTGTFVDHAPTGYGVYTFSNGTSLDGQWDWAEQQGSVFDPDYPQSIMYYTGMMYNGTYCGFGSLGFDYCGVYYGEFQGGDVSGSGKYLYRLYNKTAQVEGSNWGVMRSRSIDSGFLGSGLTLNGGLQGYGMSMSTQYKTYYIGEVENGYRGGYGRYFNPSGEERMDRRGLYVEGMFSKLA